MTGFRLGSNNKKEKLSPQGKPTALVDEVSEPKGFGIRNYLHQFYVTPTTEDVEQNGTWYLLPPPPAQRRGLFVCRVCTVVGLLLLMSGAVAIVVGYTWPHEEIEQTISKFIIFQDEQGGLYMPTDKLKLMLQDPMRYWKTSGFCLFASGAVLLAISLMIPTLAACIGTQRFAAFASNDNSPNEPPVRIFPHNTGPAPSSGPVPVMEEIAKPARSRSPLKHALIHTRTSRQSARDIPTLLRLLLGYRLRHASDELVDGRRDGWGFREAATRCA
ncbi:unnamed protein product [Caenorhabditis auriculariae]|uniref:Uncharacterized protein n=1 Tax=Caenorhabditis auriculariae TaxID=2777116 RepID=A0A8S1HG32_9PELO|nr:unnamed protein product [Caenorhabditis auriculariae]